MKQKRVVFLLTRGHNEDMKSAVVHIQGERASYLAVVLLLPALIFGYYPLLTFGKISGFNIDLSFLYLICSLVLLVSTPYLSRSYKMLLPSISLRVLFGFMAVSTLSIAWSENVVRGIATAGFGWMLFLIVCVVALHTKQVSKHWPQVRSLLLVSLLVVVLAASWQILGDALGVSSAYTLLSKPYDGSLFGIARPVGFSLEPQFLGSLLIAPFSWVAWQLLNKKESRALHIMLLTVLTTLLVLTISRGALLAATISLLILFVSSTALWKSKTGVISIVALGVLAAFVVTFSTASLRQSDSISGYQSVRGVAQQLSFGIVNLPPEASEAPVEAQPTRSEPTPQLRPSAYVASSTTGRLSTYQKAIDTWLQNPFTFFFGTGLGAFGANVNAENQSAVVNNYYLETLSETGIVGFSLFISFIGVVCIGAYRSRQWLLLAVLVGYIVQLNFFSGNANSIHIWVLLGIVIGTVLHARQQSSTSVK